MLVVGDMDVTKLAGHDKSSKHRKAEELVEAGQALRIIRDRLSGVGRAFLNSHTHVARHVNQSRTLEQPQ
ncbi:MAG: hypothetical protein R3D84_16315 [Paracoccaceae bacterium]